MPLNVMDAHFRSFAHLVLPYLVEQGIAVLGMKSFADSVLLKSGAPIEPLEYLQYSLNLPTSVVITGVESQRDLDQAFEATRTFQPIGQGHGRRIAGAEPALCARGQIRALQRPALLSMERRKMRNGWGKSPRR